MHYDDLLRYIYHCDSCYRSYYGIEIFYNIKLGWTNMQTSSKIKPLLWLVFSIGGTIAAFLLPALLFILSVATPNKFLISSSFLNYGYILTMISECWLIKTSLFLFFAFIFWHGMHRLFLTIIDILHIKHYSKNMSTIFYGFALLTTFYSFILIISF